MLSSGAGGIPATPPRIRGRPRVPEHVIMFHLTLFGGGAGELPVSDFISVTVFGGTELRRPTLARRLLHLKSMRQAAPSIWRRVFQIDKNIIVTLFGGTEILTPTVLEEYADLRRVLASGALTSDECRQLLNELARDGEGQDLYSAVTLFGGCSVERPSEDEERKALQLGLRTGLITERERETLDGAVGRSEPALAGIMGQLVGAAAGDAPTLSRDAASTRGAQPRGRLRRTPR